MKPNVFILYWRGNPKFRCANFGFEFSRKFQWFGIDRGFRLGGWTFLWGFNG